MIYLDSAATHERTEKDDVIIETMVNAMKNMWYNPSALYNESVAVKKEIEKARKTIADFIGAKPEEIYFTSGGSESNNWAIQGWLSWLNKHYKRGIVVTTEIEHKSIIKCVESSPFTYDFISVDRFGVIDVEELKLMLKLNNNFCKENLVSIHMANNEIGTIQPIKEIADVVHEYNGVLHVDAVQAFGKISIDVEELGIDMMSVSGHKISPVLRGIGFLYIKNGIEIAPLIYGSQENDMRGGTEDSYKIIGFGKAVELLEESSFDTFEKWAKIAIRRNYFMNRLKKEFNCKINGAILGRLPNNINVTFPQNITNESLMYMLDMSGIKIASGSACNSHSIEPSHVLKTIGLTDEEAMKTVRITLPENIDDKTIDAVINEIGNAIELIEIAE